MNSEPTTPDVLGPKIVSYLDWLTESAESPAGQAELGPIIEDMCLHYRALAICLFADDGNTDDFFHWLLHSPLARKHYLGTLTGGARAATRARRASFIAPVQDAIVARQWPLAEQLCALASDSWVEGEEYEDDFCYGMFLGCVLRQVNPAGVLTRWRKALEGGKDLRLDVASALAGGDAAELEEALLALLRANEERARKMTDPNTPSILASNYWFAPNRWVSVEGLAFLALAERAGISTDYELQGCPGPLRSGAYAPFRPRAYPHLPLA